MAERGSSISIEFCVRGYHVYKAIWRTTIGETLLAQAEFGNVHDPYAVAVVRLSGSTDTIVGHLPRNISTLYHIFHLRNGNIVVQVTGRRRSVDLPQGGLKVPCVLMFCGEEKYMKKINGLRSSLPPMIPAPQLRQL